MKRIGVTVTDEQHARFKAACALNLEDMSEVLDRAIEEYLERGEYKKERFEKIRKDVIDGK